MFRTLFDSLRYRPAGNSARRTPRRPRAARLHLEALDDRTMPSTFTVTNLYDSGPGSLLAAITSANANPGADDIDFATGGTIALTSDITDSLTIHGPGASYLTVRAATSRVFAIAGDPTVVIAGLTVANGRTVGSPGGGISMAGGTLTLDHVTVSENSAEGTPDLGYGGGDGLGGGLYVAGGTVYVNQCTIWGNAAGGPSAYGSYSGEDGGSGAGGGIYVAGGMVYVNQSTISENYVSGGQGGGNPTGYGGDGGAAVGGGIRVAGGTLEVRESSIISNVAIGGSPGYGGTTYGSPGVSAGGGLSIATAEPPLADLDTFIVSNIIYNTADVAPDISGPYSVNGLFPALAISNVTTLEGNTGTHAVIFTVSLSAASSQTITVDYATADGTATAGSDYQAAAGTLTIPAGQTSGTITVFVNGDRLAEANETFAVNLSSPTNGGIAVGTGVGTIGDDEPRVYISDVMVTEGNTGGTSATFLVTLSAAYDVNVTVNYATADGTATAGSDYQAASGTLTFAPGEVRKTVTVQIMGDRLPEADETFFVNLSNPTNAVIARQGAGTIADDEPRINIFDLYIDEGRKGHTTLFTFRVTLSAAYDQAVTMSFRTADGTAKTSDSDYTAKAGTLTFAPGETTKTITIEVKGDNKREADEMFYLDLFGNSSNSLFTNSRGVGTIRNDD